MRWEFKYPFNYRFTEEFSRWKISNRFRFNRIMVMCLWHNFWPGSRVVSVLDSGAEGTGFKSQSRCCRITVLGKLFTLILPLFTKQQKLVAALLRVAGITACLPPGLWLTSPAGWLPRTGISSGTLRSVIEYGLPFYPLVTAIKHRLDYRQCESWWEDEWQSQASVLHSSDVRFTLQFTQIYTIQ